MTRLDHDRALGQLATYLNCSVLDLENFCVWGNHSPTMFPDTTNLTVDGQRVELDQEWVNNQFIPEVQQRGASIIAVRGKSSAASAGNAAIFSMKDWVLGSRRWTSMSVYSNGEYGVSEGLIYSYPVTCQGGNYEIV